MNVNYVFNLLKIKVFCLTSWAPKQWSLQNFLNEDENKNRLNFKFKSQKKQEHDMCKTRIQYDFITKKKQNKTKIRLWQ